MSYASIASRNVGSSTASTLPTTSKATAPQTNSESKPPSPKREASPSHIPKTESENEKVYVLTLATDKAHHQRMTALRNEYFPKKINKLGAHLTLFHALPGSKLESSIIPVIEDIATNTKPFGIHANKPFRLKHGIAISVDDNEGGREAQAIHRALQKPWLKEGFLSHQDASGGLRLHYTIMNKVDEQEDVDRAFQDVQERFMGDQGVVEGLGLYLYDRGRWKWQKTFHFRS